MGLARHRELLVLGVLRDHDLHGYALVEALADGLGRAVGLKRPAVYALLSRLEERGLVTHQREKDSAHPERRVYQVTGKGREALPDLVRTCARTAAESTTPLALLIAHLDQLPLADRITLLETLQGELSATLAGLAEFPAHEGKAGLSLKLLSDHASVDLQTVRDLLAEERQSGQD